MENHESPFCDCPSNLVPRELWALMLADANALLVPDDAPSSVRTFVVCPSLQEAIAACDYYDREHGIPSTPVCIWRASPARPLSEYPRLDALMRPAFELLRDRTPVDDDPEHIKLRSLAEMGLAAADRLRMLQDHLAALGEKE